MDRFSEPALRMSLVERGALSLEQEQKSYHDVIRSEYLTRKASRGGEEKLILSSSIVFPLSESCSILRS